MFTYRNIASIHRYYKITKFYSFLKNTAYKGIIVTIAFLIVILGLEYTILDFNSIINKIIEDYPPQLIFMFFLVSETVLGLIPPEIFIAWASKSATPWLYLFILATLSYLGGIVSYFIGNRLFLIPAIKNQIENKIEKHISKLRKWGGFFVFVGAMLPVPHTIVSLACGVIKYKFEHYLIWALFRFVRFAIYGAIIFQIF